MATWYRLSCGCVVYLAAAIISELLLVRSVWETVRVCAVSNNSIRRPSTQSFSSLATLSVKEKCNELHPC